MMLDDIETSPPENVEEWWVEESIPMKTIRVNNDVYSALWVLQDIPEDGLSFRQITQWLLDETKAREKPPVLAADGGPPS